MIYCCYVKASYCVVVRILLERMKKLEGNFEF